MYGFQFTIFTVLWSFYLLNSSILEWSQALKDSAIDRSISFLSSYSKRLRKLRVQPKNARHEKSWCISSSSSAKARHLPLWVTTFPTVIDMATLGLITRPLPNQIPILSSIHTWKEWENKVHEKKNWLDGVLVPRFPIFIDFSDFL